MFGLPLAFAAPAVLGALLGLVALYFLLRVTPPRPRQAIFPPLRLLIGLEPTETTPARTPWPLLRCASPSARSSSSRWPGRCGTLRRARGVRDRCWS